MQRLDASLKPYHLMLCIQRWLTLVLDLLIAGLAVMLITLAVTFRGSTTAAQIGIALNVILAASATVLRLVESYTELETALGAIARIKNFERDIQPEDRPGEDFVPSLKWPGTGKVELHGITAAYK